MQRLQQDYGDDIAAFITGLREVTKLVDDLGLFTVEEFQKSRDSIIARQQQEMLELSTPVVRLFEGILAIPLIGTLDSSRTQVVMEGLLQRIVEELLDLLDGHRTYSHARTYWFECEVVPFCGCATNLSEAQGIRRSSRTIPPR